MTLEELRDRARWLSRCARRVTSQCGEDGIIEASLQRLPERNSWCVELGADDGVTNSNTYNLIRNHGYSAVVIECEKRKYWRLLQNYKGVSDVVAVNGYVEVPPGAQTLDAHLARTPVPVDFDRISLAPCSPA